MADGSFETLDTKPELHFEPLIEGALCDSVWCSFDPSVKLGSDVTVENDRPLQDAARSLDDKSDSVDQKADELANLTKRVETLNAKVSSLSMEKQILEEAHGREIRNLAERVLPDVSSALVERVERELIGALKAPLFAAIEDHAIREFAGKLTAILKDLALHDFEVRGPEQMLKTLRSHWSEDLKLPRLTAESGHEIYAVIEGTSLATCMSEATAALFGHAR